MQIESYSQFLQPATFPTPVTKEMTGVGTVEFVTIAATQRFLPGGLGLGWQRDAAKPEKNCE